MTELTRGEETITTFRQALERVSALAHARLPQELHGNLERAHALVRHHHVWMDEDGKHGQVLSSDGATWYLVNGNCTCMGVTHAPQALCKHRLAVGLYRRASELLAEQAAGSRQQGVRGDADPSPLTPSLPHSLPEAPASVNVRLTIGGADVQWTLRDASEHRLAERLEALLTRFPQAAKPAASAATAQTQGPPTCPHHGPGKESTKAPGTWYCTKRMADQSYCTWRHPAQ
jgi:hypothetical protein